MTKEKDWQERANEICNSAMECIAEMVEALDSDDDDEREQAQERISEDPLSVCVGADFQPAGETLSPDKYEILLSTGGPACRIVGNLNQYCEPSSAQLEAQDWYKPWTYGGDQDRDILLTYASQFYYGEG